MQIRPTFHALQNPETWTPKRKRSEASLLNRKLRMMIAPVNARIPLWQKQLAFFKIRKVWQGRPQVATGNMDSLKLEVRQAIDGLAIKLNEIPQSRANTRVNDTERALLTIMQALEIL